MAPHVIYPKHPTTTKTHKNHYKTQAIKYFKINRTKLKKYFNVQKAAKQLNTEANKIKSKLEKLGEKYILNMS